MNTLTHVISRHGTSTRLAYDFETPLRALTSNGKLDTVIVEADPELNPSRIEWLADELGLPEAVVEDYARQVNRAGHSVTLVALHGTRREERALRGAVLVPGRNGSNTDALGKAEADGEDRVFFQALCEAARQPGARKVGICSCGGREQHSRLAALAGKALAQFCDDTATPVLQSCSLLGQDFAYLDLRQICRCEAQGPVSQPVELQRDSRDEATVVRMQW